MNFVIIDLETTGRDPAAASIVEWAAIHLRRAELFTVGERAEYGGLVRPPGPIPAETSAVHHIVDADVVAAPRWEDEVGKLLALCDQDTILVAHNSEYERTLLTPFIGERTWLCTYKAAVRAWPDAPGHSNEVLRYHLGHGTGRTAMQQPHSALHDARVTERILGDLLAKPISVPDMLAWTKEPAMLPTCPLGEWRGKKWADVDYGFLTWILKKIVDREDVRFCAKAELDRRAAAATA